MVDPGRIRAGPLPYARFAGAAIRAANLAGPRHSTPGRARSWECVQPCWIIAAVLSRNRCAFAAPALACVPAATPRQTGGAFLPADAAARSRQRSGSRSGQAARAGGVPDLSGRLLKLDGRPLAAPASRSGNAMPTALPPPRRFRAGRDRSRFPGLRSDRERRRGGAIDSSPFARCPTRGAHRIFTSPCIRPAASPSSPSSMWLAKRATRRISCTAGSRWSAGRW